MDVGPGESVMMKRNGEHFKGEAVGLDDSNEKSCRFTSGISNYTCRKLGFEEDNVEIACLLGMLHR